MLTVPIGNEILPSHRGPSVVTSNAMVIGTRHLQERDNLAPMVREIPSSFPRTTSSLTDDKSPTATGIGRRMAAADTRHLRQSRPGQARPGHRHLAVELRDGPRTTTCSVHGRRIQTSPALPAGAGSGNGGPRLMLGSRTAPAAAPRELAMSRKLMSAASICWALPDEDLSGGTPVAVPLLSRVQVRQERLEHHVVHAIPSRKRCCYRCRRLDFASARRQYLRGSTRPAPPGGPPRGCQVAGNHSGPWPGAMLDSTVIAPGEQAPQRLELSIEQSVVQMGGSRSCTGTGSRLAGTQNLVGKLTRRHGQVSSRQEISSLANPANSGRVGLATLIYVA